MKVLGKHGQNDRIWKEHQIKTEATEEKVHTNYVP